MTTLSKAARDTLARITPETPLMVTRLRVTLAGETVSRRVFEALLEADAICYSHKPNNMMRAYVRTEVQP